MQQQIDLTIETRYLNNFVVHRSYSFIEILYKSFIVYEKGNKIHNWFGVSLWNALAVGWVALLRVLPFWLTLVCSLLTTFMFFLKRLQTKKYDLKKVGVLLM